MVEVAARNVNNRVGRTTFRPQAAQATMALGADVIVFNEFFPGPFIDRFFADLDEGGWSQQVMSTAPAVSANRVLIAARVPLEQFPLPPSNADEHLSANAGGRS